MSIWSTATCNCCLCKRVPAMVVYINRYMQWLFTSTGTCNSWTLFANSNVVTSYTTISNTNLVTCQAACIANPFCTGVDFNPTENRCWIITTRGPEQVRVGMALGVNHYDLTRTCGGRYQVMHYFRSFSIITCQMLK